MGMVVRYVESDKRTGRLSYRRVFPPALRPHVPGQNRELKRSLRATSLDDPAAIQSYADAQAEYERLTALAQKAVAGQYDTLDAATIAWLAEAFRAEALEGDESARWDSGERELYALLARQSGAVAQFDGEEGSRWGQKRRESLEASAAHSRALLGRGDLSAIGELWAWEADQFAFAKGLRLDTSSPQFGSLCVALCRASLDAAEAGLARLDGDTVATPELPDRPSKAGTETATAKLETMDSLAAKLMEQRVDPVGPSTQQSWRTALRFWREWHGELASASITRRKVSDWLEGLAMRPKGMPRKMEALPLPALLERYAGEDIERLAGKTVRQHLGSMSAIWNKAEKAGYIEGANPFARHSVKVERRAGGNPFTPDELGRMLALPVFTEGERPIRGRGEAVYWLPLFALFTGARPNEIAQLLVSDFERDGEGNWWMEYTDTGEHPAAGPRRLKTSRHGTGARKFRVPSQIIDLGLPRYLDWLQSQSEAALFPKLTASTKGLHEAFSRFWGPYLRRHGVVGEGKRQVREFRHNWTTAARASGISEGAISYLMGHSVTSGPVTRSYGEHSPFGAEMAKLNYAGLGLSNVLPWEPPQGE